MNPRLRVVDELAAVPVPFVPSTEESIADVRSIAVNAAQIGVLEAASAELRQQGFLLYPGILDGIARRYHEAGNTPVCSCGGQGICLVCTLASFEDGAA